MEKFKSFITEEKGDKYRILVVSAALDKDRMYHTAERFTVEAKKMGHEVYVCKVEGAIITFENNVYKIFNSDDEEGFEINKDTVAIVRGSIRFKKSYLDILSRLEKIGVCMVNNRETVEISADKYRTYIK